MSQPFPRRASSIQMILVAMSRVPSLLPQIPTALVLPFKSRFRTCLLLEDHSVCSTNFLIQVLLLTVFKVYHLHDHPVPTDGNCTNTLAHLDPFQRGEVRTIPVSVQFLELTYLRLFLATRSSLKPVKLATFLARTVPSLAIHLPQLTPMISHPPLLASAPSSETAPSQFTLETRRALHAPTSRWLALRLEEIVRHQQALHHRNLLAWARRMLQVLERL